MGSYDWNGYGPYVSKAEKIQKALKTREKMAKKGVVLDPVIVEERTISRTWWGQSWIQNLERYADYSNRLPRGRSYLRNGSILDLKIDSNKITALVTGSRSKPYKIGITIKSISKSAEAVLMKKGRESLDSMHSLLAGDFPPELKEEFFKQGSGLFPSPKEISIDCSCPDWATMCKHVAGALYGVAVRLDEKPELFFTLRGIDIKPFVVSVAKEESKKLLQKSKILSSRVLSSDESDDDMAELFGIALEGKIGNYVSEEKDEPKKIIKIAKAVTKKATRRSPVKKENITLKKASAVNRPEKQEVKTVKKSAKKAVKMVKKDVLVKGTKKATKKKQAK